MSKVRRVDFYPDEWIAGTIQLDNAERGLYITICALIYSRGGAIDIEHLQQTCRDHGHAFKRQLSRLVELGKLIVNDGQITNKRAINELQNADKRLVNAQQNGAKGGRPNRLAKPAGSFDEKLTINYQLSTINQEESVVSDDTTLRDPVKEIFDRGTAILGGNRSLIGKMRKQHGDVTVLEAIVACENERPSDAASYFVACCRGRAGPVGPPPTESPVTTLYRGAFNAAAKWDARHGNSGADCSPDVALLDCSRSVGDAGTTD